MTKDEFLMELQDIMQRDDTLEPEMTLKELPEWDSLTMMALASFFDKNFSKTLNFSDFQSFITVNDLLSKANLTQ